MTGGTVTVRLTDTYRCGRSASREVHLAPPLPDEPLSGWWDRVVLPETGDGHPCGASEHALYEAEVVAAPSEPGMAGAMTSWEG